MEDYQKTTMSLFWFLFQTKNSGLKVPWSSPKVEETSKDDGDYQFNKELKILTIHGKSYPSQELNACRNPMPFHQLKSQSTLEDYQITMAPFWSLVHINNSGFKCILGFSKGWGHLQRWRRLSVQQRIKDSNCWRQKLSKPSCVVKGEKKVRGEARGWPAQRRRFTEASFCLKKKCF